MEYSVEFVVELTVLRLWHFPFPTPCPREAKPCSCPLNPSPMKYGVMYGGLKICINSKKTTDDVQSPNEMINMRAKNTILRSIPATTVVFRQKIPA